MSSTLAGFAPDRLPSHRAAVRAADAGRASSTPLPPALRVPLNDNGPWHESLLIQPSPQPGGSVSVRIESLLDTARRPAEAQVRYRGTLDRDALLRLREAIDAVLGGTAANAATGKAT